MQLEEMRKMIDSLEKGIDKYYFKAPSNGSAEIIKEYTARGYSAIQGFVNYYFINSFIKIIDFNSNILLLILNEQTKSFIYSFQRLESVKIYLKNEHFSIISVSFGLDFIKY